MKPVATLGQRHQKGKMKDLQGGVDFAKYEEDDRESENYENISFLRCKFVSIVILDIVIIIITS